MHVKLQEGNKTHLSHLHHYVSSYETNEKTVSELETSILNALKIAKEKYESQIVEQDCLEHILLVHPNGNISLYREVGHYEIVNY